VALDRAVGLEAAEGEGVDVFLKRHAVLKPQGDGDGEAVEEASEGGAFLVHVQEYFAEVAVLVFPGADENRVAANLRLLRVALPAVGQGLPGAAGFPFVGLSCRGGFVAVGRAQGSLHAKDGVRYRVRAGGEGRERLGKLRAVPVQRHRLETALRPRFQASMNAPFTSS